MNIFLRSKWNQVVIKDLNALSGRSIFDMIKLITEVYEFKFITLDDIHGGGEFISDLEKIECENSKISEVINIIQNVKQFDWGDFFLFFDDPKNWADFSEGQNYSKTIALSDTTIRAIDDTYIYIYTPYKKIVNAIKENYLIEEIKYNYLEKLDYPY